MIQGVVHPTPSQILAPLLTESGSERVRWKQQLATNQERWWSSDYLQAVPRLWNVCLPASRLISLIAWASKQNSSPLCLRWSCVHSFPSTLKESQDALTSICPERHSQNRTQLLPSPWVALSFCLDLFFCLQNQKAQQNVFFWHLYCPANDCSIASLQPHLCLYSINSTGVFLSDTQTENTSARKLCNRII